MTWWLWFAILSAQFRAAPGQPRTLRMGYEHSPPVQLVDAEGRLSGPIYEALSQAAARQGTRLEWIHCPQGPDQALAGREADSWPLMADLPERREHFGFSAPYMRPRYWLMTRQPGDLRSLISRPEMTVALPQGKLARKMAERYTPLVPHLRTIPVAGAEQGVALVCRGQAHATLVAQGTGEIFALRNADCAGQKPYLHSLPDGEIWFGIGHRKDDRAAGAAARVSCTKACCSSTIRANSAASSSNGGSCPATCACLAI